MSTQTPYEDPDDKLRQVKRELFLDAFRRCGNVLKAAAAVGIHRDTHYHWLQADPAYEEEFRKARIFASHVLEEEAFRRAHDGVEEDVYQGGVRVGAVRKHSDTLLIFLLKGLRPNVYREYYKHEMSGPGGAPIRTSNLDLSKLSDAQLAALEQMALVAAGEEPSSTTETGVERSTSDTLAAEEPTPHG